MKDSNNFFKTVENQESGWLWNGKSIKMLSGKNVEIEKKVESDFISNISFKLKNGKGDNFIQQSINNFQIVH